MPDRARIEQTHRNDDEPALQPAGLVPRAYDATLGFYRKLGVHIEDGPPGDIRHAHLDGDVTIHIDNEHLAGLYNSSWRSGEQSRVVVGFRVDSAQDVDARYADRTDAGYVGVQPPYDTFWGARYAILADPDGTHVGLMSPPDDTLRYWPPDPAPRSDGEA
jgi:uncharacterized glyoxalase superfamily protein PhnB